MTKDDIIDAATRDLKGLATKLTPDNFEDAVDDSLRETGWTLPTSDNFQILWIKRRTKRHLTYMLTFEAASKFKFEQINSQQKFDHYLKLIEIEDREFKEIQEAEPDKFVAGVSLYQLFGHKIDAGFAYDELGNDVTYGNKNKVIISPSKE